MGLTRRARSAVEDPRFPGFTDVTEIGIGSLATVYRAREAGTSRLVALKRLNVHDATPRAIESFERESLALGAVSSHPNIVTLYRSFRSADGRPVLVLELCAGAIGDRLRDGAGLPVPEVVGFGIKIAGALETAHRAGILHRDVKPQNILITDFGEPALADFGVAMLQSATQTTAGLFDFTTLHAAPELLEGGPTSAATDVYELASSLYQLIAGRPAFRAFDGESPASVILRILRDPVRSLVDAQVPAQLSDLLVQAMSKDLDSRPQTAEEFAAGLATVEIDEQWPRTQFLIRTSSPSGGGTDTPVISRLPTPRRIAAPAATGWSPVTVVGRPVPATRTPAATTVTVFRPPAMPAELEPFVATPRPAEAREVVLERVVVERIEWVPSDAASVRKVSSASDADDDDEGLLDPFWTVPDEPTATGARGESGTQYPIPPVAASSDTAGAKAADFRLPAADETSAPEPGARLILRSRLDTLLADDDGLVARHGLRRQVIPWSDVHDFEQRFDGSPWSKGQLVAITANGPVELPATRGLAVDLRRVQAQLQHVRKRALS